MQPTGDEVREAREALRLSRAELAARLDVSESTIQRIERGDKAGARTLRAIAKYLKLGDYRTAGPTIREATDVELVEELLRRALERERSDDSDDDASGRRPVADLAPPDEQGYLTEAARRHRHLRDLDNPDNAG